MKKITEKDLSLDKQVVSDLSVTSSEKVYTKDCFESLDCTNSQNFECKTNEPACEASYNANTCRCTVTDECEDSEVCNTLTQFEICCDKTVKDCPTTIPVVLSQLDCPVVDTTEEGCITPIPETQHC